MALSRKFTLRDSATPTTSVILYNISKYDARPEVLTANTQFVLGDGSRAIDYGIDKRRYNFTISIEAGKTADWTAAMLTNLETLYALRTSQTIQLVDDWKETAEVVTVHFSFFAKRIGDEAPTDAYTITLLEA